MRYPPTDGAAKGITLHTVGKLTNNGQELSVCVSVCSLCRVCVVLATKRNSQNNCRAAPVDNLTLKCSSVANPIKRVVPARCQPLRERDSYTVQEYQAGRGMCHSNNEANRQIIK